MIKYTINTKHGPLYFDEFNDATSKAIEYGVSEVIGSSSESNWKAAIIIGQDIFVPIGYSGRRNLEAQKTLFNDGYNLALEELQDSVIEFQDTVYKAEEFGILDAESIEFDALINVLLSTIRKMKR